MLKQCQCFANDCVQIDLAEFRAAGAREIQQAVDDLRGAEGLLRDLFEQRRQPFIAAHLLGEHLRVGGDDGERRIDFMGDSGGKQADGGELFRLAELGFKLHALGDVVDQDDAANRFEIARDQRRDGDVGGTCLACRASPGGTCRDCARRGRSLRGEIPA